MEWRAMLVLVLVFESALFSFAYEVQDTSDAMAYLGRFGYIGKDKASSMNIIDASAVIKEFQHMAGINETGFVDKETLEMMNKPRCGNKDMAEEMIPDEDEDNSIRRKRYKVSETKAKWRKRELTYRITKFSDQMSIRPDMVQRDVTKAFKLWEEATNLNFIQSNDKNVDIELGFASEKHQDQFPFDGPGKTLAHAFSPGPGLGGDVHFDDHEKWSVDSPTGTNVLFVAVHEIGHSLGLSHSDQKGAIMQAFYGGYRPHLKLHEDDISGIQYLYGKRGIVPSLSGGKSTYFSPTTSKYTPNSRFFPTWGPMRRVDVLVTTPKYIDVVTQSATKITTTTKKSSLNFGPRLHHPNQSDIIRPDLCKKDTRIDAITTIDGKIYLFTGFYVFQLDERTGEVVPDWPKRLEYVFQGLEPHVDAAFTRSNGKTYILKGGKYWRLSGFKVDSGYPKALSKHFPGIPDYIDSGFVHPINEQIYLTKGNNYWRFDPVAKGRPHVQSFYPLSISLWQVDSTSIDAAFVSSTGSAYFFKGDRYWKFDTKEFKVLSANPPYPRESKDYWFGCTTNKKSEPRIPAPSVTR